MDKCRCSVCQKPVKAWLDPTHADGTPLCEAGFWGSEVIVEEVGATAQAGP